MYATSLVKFKSLKPIGRYGVARHWVGCVHGIKKGRHDDFKNGLMPQSRIRVAISIYNRSTALHAMRSLESTQSKLSTSLQRLASGLRVDSARDDAAGLTISERMLTQVRGMNQSLRNTNDSISLIQQLDGFAGQYVAGLQRIRELAIQAINGTNRAQDRLALDKEVQQALLELDRSATAQQFNGRSVADGTWGIRSLQIGANTGDTVSLALDTNYKRSAIGATHTLASSDLRSIGAFTFDNTYTTGPIATTNFSLVNQPFIGGQASTAGITVTNYTGAAAVGLAVDGISVVLDANYGSVAGVSNAIQTQLNLSNSGEYAVSAVGSTISIKKNASASNPTAAVSLGAGGNNAADFTSGTQTAGQVATTSTYAAFSVDGLGVSLNADFGGNVGALVADIQAQIDARTAGPSLYTVSGDASGISFIKNGTIVAPTVGGFSGIGASVFGPAAAATLTLVAGDFSVEAAGGPARSVVGTFSTAESLAAAINATGANLYASIDPATGSMEISSSAEITLSGSMAGGTFGFGSLTSTSSGSLLNATVLDAKNARATVQRIDAALVTTSAARANYGATQNRMESILANTRISMENASSARGRIVDADYAVEAHTLQRSRLLQMAGLALLAQAQVNPSMVLQLLRLGQA